METLLTFSTRLLLQSRCVIITIIIVSLMLTACRKSAPPNTQAKGPPKELTAEDVIQQMIEAYRNAQNYSDNGHVRLHYVQNGVAHEDKAPLSVTVQIPNHIVAEIYQTTIVSDGKELFARIKDEATEDLDGQVFSREVSSRLNLSNLYDDELLDRLIKRDSPVIPFNLNCSWPTNRWVRSFNRMQS